MIQNLAGNKWDKRGVITNVLPYDQHEVLVDGSRRLTIRNRKHIRKFTPISNQTTRNIPLEKHHLRDTRSHARRQACDQSLYQEDIVSQSGKESSHDEDPPELDIECPPPDDITQQTFEESPMIEPEEAIVQPQTDENEVTEYSTANETMGPPPLSLRRSGRVFRGTTTKYKDYER